VLRGLSEKRFDFLLPIIFNRDFSIRSAYKIPHDIVEKHARYKEYVNGHILTITADVTSEFNVEDISEALRNCSSNAYARANPQIVSQVL